MPVKITYSGAVPGVTLTQREMNAITRDGWHDVGVFWHREQRPKHFTGAGAREYGYLPRSGEPGNVPAGGFWTSYTGRKQRRFGHRKPLVYSGELQALTMARRILTTATANSSRLRIQMPLARKANFRHPKSKIDMRKELTTVSSGEAKTDVRLLAKVVNNQLRHFGRRLTR